MDKKALGLIIAAITTVVCGTASNSVAALAPPTGVATNVDVGFFYDRLTPYGDWWEHPRWGWVWSPRDVAVGWRPYTLGRWIYTDDYGWLWESDEDWGWACFHYGRWDWDNNFGWFWVPGSYWGPAWVGWRTGPGLIGWCALPPVIGWQSNVGLVFDGVSLGDIPARRWVFVEASFFDAPRLDDHILLFSRNITLLRETRPFARFESVDGRIVNRAFSARQIEEFTHRPVTRFRVRHVESPAAMHVFREHDGEIALFTPHVRRGPAGVVPPAPGELERRQRAERSHLQEQQQAERSRQEQRHRAEHAGPGAQTEQLQRRQEAERQALQSEHQRQQQLLEGRQQRERGGPAAQQPSRLRAPGMTGRTREPSAHPERMPEQQGRPSESRHPGETPEQRGREQPR
jgi:hypothetical protein